MKDNGKMAKHTKMITHAKEGETSTIAFIEELLLSTRPITKGPACEKQNLVLQSQHHTKMIKNMVNEK